MAKTTRFSDDLVPVEDGGYADLRVTIDRKGSDYERGALARKAGEPRDETRGLNWLLGWDEAPEAKG